MRASLVIALLLPLPAAAQLVFEKTTIRVFEQADGEILPFERRVYSTRFDATRTRMLGVEILANYGRPESTAKVAVDCTLKKPDGSVAPSQRPMEFQFFADQKQSQSANLLWGGGDWRWTPGAYEVDCKAGGNPLGKAQFEIALNPPEVADGTVRVAAIRLFQTGDALPPRAMRRYLLRFASGETGRIGVELEFSHAPLGREARFPVDCWFFWPDGQTSPALLLSYEPEATWAGGFSAGAMGWPEPGNWRKGVYTITCAMHGQPVAIERFEVS
jgi:hypothetical protein